MIDRPSDLRNVAEQELEDEQRRPPALYARDPAWRGGDVRDLWPDLDERTLQSAADAIGQAVGALLRGGRPSLGHPGGGDARALGIASLVTGVGPLLGYWVETGLLDVTEPAARVFARHLAHGRRRVERIRNEALPVLGQLVKVGAAPAVMKGFHTAHSYFPDAGTRPFGDVDVVIAPEHIPRAEAELRTAGFVGTRGMRVPYKWDWRPAAMDQRVWSFEHWHVRSPWKLELHDAITFNHLAKHGLALSQDIAFDGMWTALGVPLRVLTREPLLAILAIHASGELQQSRLLRLVELVYVARQGHAAANGRLQWANVEELLVRTDTLRYTYPALALAERLAPGTIDGGVLERARRAGGRRVRAVTDRFTPTSRVRPNPFRLRERLMWSSSWRMTLATIVDLIAPRHTPPRDMIRLYHSRVLRLLWSVTPGHRDQSRPPGAASS